MASPAEERLLEGTGAGEGLRYCVYGHTQAFRHEALGCAADGSELVFLNSGTWRPRVAETRAGKSFVGFKEMTYLVFYQAGEDGFQPGPDGRAHSRAPATRPGTASCSSASGRLPAPGSP